MEKNEQKYVAIAYELYVDNEKGNRELVESVPADHPYQFITGMGLTLDAFEAKIAAMPKGEKFEFALEPDEAYGKYEKERVKELDKSIFSVDGHFDSEYIYPGNVIPLVNSDGNRFDGLIMEVKDKTVVVDLNHQLAGKKLHFKGTIVESREATNEEIEGVINRLNGGGCCCDDDCCGGCHDEEHHHDGGCCHDHEGKGCGCH